MLQLGVVLVVEPNQLLFREPIGSMIQLNCSGTRNDLVGLTWRVQVRSEGIFTSSPDDLRAVDIILTGDTVSFSQLDIINASLRINGTIANCEANISRQDGNGFIQCGGELLTIDIYGKCVCLSFWYVRSGYNSYYTDRPLPPVGVTVVGIAVSSVLLSWSLASPEEVVENFTLTAVNLNITSSSPIIVQGIVGMDYLLEEVLLIPCDLYSFQLIAWNDLGPSSPTDPITGKIPIQPRITLDYSLRKILGGQVELAVILNATKDVSMYTCAARAS